MAEKTAHRTLGDYIVQAMREGRNITLTRAEAEPIYADFCESISPKIDEVRRQNRPTPEIRSLRLD